METGSEGNLEEKGTEQGAVWGFGRHTGSAELPWSHCPVSGVASEWACAVSTRGLRVRLQGFGEASYVPPERDTHKTGPFSIFWECLARNRTKMSIYSQGEECPA